MPKIRIGIVKTLTKPMAHAPSIRKTRAVAAYSKHREQGDYHVSKAHEMRFGPSQAPNIAAHHDNAAASAYRKADQVMKIYKGAKPMGKRTRRGL